MSDKIILNEPQNDCYAFDSVIEDYVRLRTIIKGTDYPDFYWWIVEKDNGEHILSNVDRLSDFHKY